MFFGRKKELQILKEKFQAKKFQFTVIYGRRRVGKTTLISEYIKDKPAIYFQATEGTEKSNLEKVSRSFTKFEGKSSEIAMIAQSFDDLFAQLTKISKDKQMIFVIDEFPYLAQSYPEISSVIQYFIDHKWKENTKLHLILSGSSMSFMEHQVLGYKSRV
jgi:AAA+ ATPase superfamily predicted ATPase